MAEDKENNKPKTTLIKHQKQEKNVSSESGQEEKKKKVVVVKKKVVVKKSAKVVPVASRKESDNKDSETSLKKDDKEKKNSGNDNNRNFKRNESERRSRNDDKKTYANQTRNGYSPRESGQPGGGRYQNNRNYQGSGNNNRSWQGGSRPPYQGRSNNNDNNSRPSGQGGNYRSRPPRQDRGSRPYNPNTSGRPGSPSNAPGRTGGRPGSVRPSNGGRPSPGGRPGSGRPPQNSSTSSNSLSDSKKTTNKKFFKAKNKKKDYKKTTREDTEKAYQFNKKKAIKKANPVPKEIEIMEVITVSELARKMNLKASDLISKLMGMGMMVTINQQIDAETATILADEFKCKVKIVSLYDETIIESDKDVEDDMRKRPPIITVMGHVDHGKTKLLDAVRSADVVSGEFGGITQHIGAYTIHTDQCGEMTFLDTPGHSAFTMMRARGAQLTDIVVLVVAANDGVMPQTIEAINHAKEAEVPIIVAVNKVDLPEANPDRVKQQLSEYNLIPEEWGGKTQFINISALKKTGIDDLLEAIHLEAELLELKANWNCKAEGKIIESKVDQGRGIVSTVLVQRGILQTGDSFVAGIFHGKVRAMFDDKGNKVDKATPSLPVEILGFSGIPNSGDPFQMTENEKIARQFGNKRQELKKQEEAKNLKKITLANLYDSIQDGEVQELKVIIKGDVHGSVEALQQSLEKLSTSEIRLVCIHAAAGAIVDNDVYIAAASNAIIIGFHVRPTPQALKIAEQEKVEIRKYNIIYDAVEDIREAMEGLLSPDLKEETVGTVEVRETFKVPKIGTIAGCMVTSGIVSRKSQVHVIRDEIEVHTGAISSLKRFKDDAKEVREGFECGLSVENFPTIQVGDILEVFEMREIAKKLNPEKKD